MYTWYIYNNGYPPILVLIFNHEVDSAVQISVYENSFFNRHQPARAPNIVRMSKQNDSCHDEKKGAYHTKCGVGRGYDVARLMTPDLSYYACREGEGEKMVENSR